MKLNKRDQRLFDQHLVTVRNDREPTRLAFAMLRAVAQHVRDLQQDDPGDEPKVEQIILENALRAVEQAGFNLEQLIRR